jgi:cystathionine beta-lyase
MDHAANFDQIDLAHLRSAGGLKWSLFPDQIGAFVAEMDFGTAPVVTGALHDAVDRGMFGYLPNSVSVAMSEASAAWHHDAYGWDLTPDQIHPIADVVKGLELAIEHFSRPGAPVILPTPAYMPFLLVPPALGREIIEVPLVLGDNGYQMDLDGLDAAFRAGGHLLVLCNPYNPVGRVFSTQELAAIGEVVARNGGRVFSDEIHAPLVFPGSRHVPYASVSSETAGHTVTATSASKAFNLPGLKCAQFILSNEADLETYEPIGRMASHGASTLGVIANTTAFTTGRSWLEAVIVYLDSNRRLLSELVAEHLPGVRYLPPQGTYIGWLDCRGLGLDGSPADFFAEQAGVALTDGAACGEAGIGFARIIFATPRPILTQAVASMGEAVRSHRSSSGS